MSFEIDAADFDKDLINYIDNLLPKGIEAGIAKACLIVERDAKLNCPIDDGPLRASINHDVKVSDTEVNGYVGSGLEYALYRHQGTGIFAAEGNGRQTPWVYKDKNGKLVRTVGMKPVPFLKDAVDKNKDDIKNIILNSLNGGR